MTGDEPEDFVPELRRWILALLTTLLLSSSLCQLLMQSAELHGQPGERQRQLPSVALLLTAKKRRTRSSLGAFIACDSLRLRAHVLQGTRTLGTGASRSSVPTSFPDSWERWRRRRR